MIKKFLFVLLSFFIPLTAITLSDILHYGKDKAGLCPQHPAVKKYKKYYVGRKILIPRSIQPPKVDPKLLKKPFKNPSDFCYAFHNCVANDQGIYLYLSTCTGWATLENIRSPQKTAAYNNQDRIAVYPFKEKLFLGVFDGHGTDGGTIAQLACNLLAPYLLIAADPKQALAKAGKGFQSYLSTCKVDAQQSGATAVMALLDIPTRQLYVGNIGDSRLIVCRKNNVIFSTQDHKPTNPNEYARIKKAGGFVRNGYACHPDCAAGLALSRSLGDLEAHGCSTIIADAEVTYIQLEHDDIIVLASDGLWDVLSNQDVADYIHNHSELANTPHHLAQKLVDTARTRESVDDISALVTHVI